MPSRTFLARQVAKGHRAGPAWFLSAFCLLTLPAGLLPADEPSPPSKPPALRKMWRCEPAAAPPGGDASSDAAAATDRETAAAPGKATLAIDSLAYFRDGKSLLVGMAGSDESPGSVCVWDAARGKLRRSFPGVEGRQAVAISADSKVFASPGLDGHELQVKVWDLLKSSERVAFPARLDAVLAVALSPNGKLLAWAGDHDDITLADLPKREVIRTFTAHDGAIRSLAFSPDGRVLASGATDANGRNVRLWDVPSGKPQAQMSGHTGDVECVAFSADGKRLAAAGSDRSIRVWQVAGGEQPTVIEGHDDTVFSLAWAPDGRTLASSGADRNVRLWDIASGQRLISIGGSTRAVRAVAFTRDGKLLATACDDGMIKIWDVTDYTQRK